MASQRMIARDALPLIQAKLQDSGTCVTGEEGIRIGLEALNIGTQALVKRIDSEGLLFDWYVPVNNCCIALPQDCREARYIVLNGVPLRQRDEWYVGKVATGRCYGGCGIAECDDLGDFYTPQPLPKVRGIRIALVATTQADVGKTCTVETFNEYGVTVRQDLTLLANGVPAIMDEVAYQEVTYFHKPKTVGNVLMQLHYDDGQRFQFCSYNPDTEEGLFRRKSIPNRFNGCNIAKVKGKLRFHSITSQDDILPFNDILALGFMVQAVARWKANDNQGYNDNITLALNELNKQMEDADSARNVRQITFLTQGGCGSQATGRRRWN